MAKARRAPKVKRPEPPPVELNALLALCAACVRTMPGPWAYPGPGDRVLSVLSGAAPCPDITAEDVRAARVALAGMRLGHPGDLGYWYALLRIWDVRGAHLGGVVPPAQVDLIVRSFVPELRKVTGPRPGNDQ